MEIPDSVPMEDKIASEHRRWVLPLIGRGLVAAGLGLILTTTPASADDRVTVKTLIDQGIGKLPPSPLCWGISITDISPGQRFPVSGYSVRKPNFLSYILDGTTAVEFEDGSNQSFEPGTARIVPDNAPHAYQYPESTRTKQVNFSLNVPCDQPSNPNSVLEGINPDRAYRLQMMEVKIDQEGFTSVQASEAAITLFVVEGNVDVKTGNGIKTVKAQHTLTTVANNDMQISITKGRTRVLMAVLSPDKQLPALDQQVSTPATLPSAGDNSYGIAAITSLAGAFLTSVGLRLRGLRRT